MTNAELDPLLREADIIGIKGRPETGIFRVSHTYFRDLVRAGAFPAPLKLGRLSFWKRSVVVRAIAKLTEAGA